MMREKGGGEVESPLGGLQPVRTPSADYYSLPAGWQSHPSGGRLDLEALPSRMLAGMPPLSKSPFSAAASFGRRPVLSPDRTYPSGMESSLDRDASSLYNRASLTAGYRGSADLIYGGEQPPPPPLSVPTYHSSKDAGYLGLACPPESNGGALYGRSVLENSLFNRSLSMASLPSNHPNLVPGYRSHLTSSAGEDFSMERPLDRKFVFGSNHASSSLLPTHPYNRLLENYSAHSGEHMSEAVKSNLESSVGERTGAHYGSPLPTHMAFSTGASYISRNPPLYPFAHLSSSFTPESYTSYASSLTHLSSYGQLSAAPPPAHSRAHDAFAQRSTFVEEESKAMEGSVGQPFDATMSRDFTTAPAPQWDHSTIAAEPKRESTMGSYDGQTQRPNPSVTDRQCNCYEDTQALPLPKEEDALEQLMGNQFVAVGSQEKIMSVQSESCDQTSSRQNPCHQMDTNSWSMTDSRYAAHSMAALASANSAHSSPVVDINTNERPVHQQQQQASYSVNSSQSTASTFLSCSEPAVFPARFTSTASATSCSYIASRNSSTVCQAPEPSCLYSGTDGSEVDSGLEPKLQQQSPQIPGKDNRFVSVASNTGQLNEKRFPYVLIARTTAKDISAYTSAKIPRKDPPLYDSSTSEYEPPSPCQQTVKTQKRGRKPGVTVRRRTITTSYQEDSDDAHDDTHSSKIKLTIKTERVTAAPTEKVPKSRTTVFKKRQKRKGITQNKVKVEGGKRNRTCPLCLKTFSRADSLTCHMRVHTGDRPYQCDQCAASYKVSSHLRDHIRSKHSDAKPFECEKCGKPFTYSTARRRHEKICGKDLAERVEYQCATCNKGFVTSKGFSKHQEKCGVVQSDGAAKGERMTYKCKNCRKVFDSLPSLDGHQRFFCGKTKNLQTGHFLCADCGKAFFKRNPYIVHMHHHAGGKPFRCVQCEGCFYSKDSLKRHMERHKRNSKFKCSSCDAAFFVKRCLSLHVMRVHGGLKEYKCKECEWDFSCGYHLCRHRRIVHRHVKQFKYVLVGKGFTGASSWMKHRRQHPFEPYRSQQGQIIRRHVCKFCNRSFSMEDMRLHISSAHPGVTLSEALSKQLARCKLCCKDFSCQESLHVHRLRHRGKKRFRCHHCDTVFLLKSVLRLHWQRKHADYQPHSCPECEKTFRWQASVRQHMITHHGHRTQNGEQDNNRFMCNVCGKRFRQQVFLNVHMKLHCAAVPHICPQCGKGFVDLKHLKLHMSRHDHDDPKSFVCEKCGAAFISHQRLHDHMRRRHTEQPKRAWLCDECGQSLCRRDSLQKHMALHVKYRNGLIPRGPRKGAKRPKRNEWEKTDAVQGLPSSDPPDPEQKTISSRFSDFANAYGISEADLVDLKPANFAPPDLGTSPSLGVIPNFGAASRFGPTTPGFAAAAPPNVAQQPLTTQEQFNYQYHYNASINHNIPCTPSLANH